MEPLPDLQDSDRSLLASGMVIAGHGGRRGTCLRGKCSRQQAQPLLRDHDWEDGNKKDEMKEGKRWLSYRDNSRD